LVHGSEIDAFHQRLVMVLTHDGVRISTGRINVSRTNGAAEPRVDLVFETETMACAIGVPVENLPRLRDSFDGSTYSHRLPAGENFWVSRLPVAPVPMPQLSPAAAAELVETFPLPPNARLHGFGATQPGKRNERSLGGRGSA
jgi:hypothetical protein